LDLLLTALPRILEQAPDVRVFIGGWRATREALKRQPPTRHYGQVVFTGRVPHSEVNRYYDLVDVLVYPRHSMRLTELVTPLKPLEAMRQGRLFVAIRCGRSQRINSRWRNGMLFRAESPHDLANKVLQFT